MPSYSRFSRSLFLSTPSARRATVVLCPICNAGNISIHALREEGDFLFSAFVVEQKHFYPRPPRGGRRGVGRIPYET